MPDIFEEASKATEEMFDTSQPVLDDVEEAASQQQLEMDAGTEQQSDETQAQEKVPEEVPSEQTEQQAVLGDAVQTAEIAAQVAAQRDAEVQQLRQELEAERERTTQMQGAIDELSRQNQENIIEEALQPPVLDISGLAFADEDTIKAAQSKYAEDMLNYNRSQIMKELSPFVEQAKMGMYEKEKNEMLSVLAQVPELQGISDMVPQLERIIHNNKALSSDDIPLDEKFITAYAIAKGVGSINTPPTEPPNPPTTEELMELYKSNPEFQEMIEKQRLSEIKQSQQVPPFSASSGAVNAALNIKEEPKEWDDASKRTRAMFGLE